MDVDRTEASENRVEAAREFRSLQLQLQRKMDGLVENKKHVDRLLFLQGVRSQV